jgi:hypothetical protein
MGQAVSDIRARFAALLEKIDLLRYWFSSTYQSYTSQVGYSSREIKQKSGESETLKQQILDGLEKLNFENRIIDSLINRKKSKYENAFFIGDSGDIKVRFLIFIEPKGKF